MVLVFRKRALYLRKSGGVEFPVGAGDGTTYTAVVEKDGVCFDRICFYTGASFGEKLVAVFDGADDELAGAIRKSRSLAWEMARELEKPRGS